METAGMKKKRKKEGGGEDNPGLSMASFVGS